MSTGKSNFTIKQGTTFRKEFQWIAGGVPVDMTGWKARMQIREDYSSKDFIAELTTENGGITIEPLEGRLLLYISSEETSTFKFDSAVYDIELIDQADEVHRDIEGKIKLSLEVTR